MQIFNIYDVLCDLGIKHNKVLPKATKKYCRLKNNIKCKMLNAPTPLTDKHSIWNIHQLEEVIIMWLTRRNHII